MAEEHAQRRLAAILAADVVGYSRLMGADEVGTHLALKTLRREMIEPKADRYNGRTVKLMGDGALMEFTSVVDAVQFAVEVQQAMRERNRGVPESQQIEYRIGINLGDIIVDGDDVYGDGVNVAARLEALAEPGGICVRRNVRDEVRDKLDLQFKDLGEVEVKNIARPVRCFAVVFDEAAEAAPQALSAQEPALPDKPSIAVLPFQNMSRDPEQEFFADGMAEDIITGLSRYRSLFVIARNSTFAYKGQSPDLREVASDLGVRYVLEGSIRKAGQRIRVTAQLIEGAGGAHIWAERYDRELTDIFTVQDEITEAIVAAIGPEIDQVERDRAQRLAPDNLDAWESYQRGLWHLYRFNEADNAEAQRLFRLASAQSPTFAPAHSGLTHAFYFSYMHGYAKDRSATLAEAFESGRRAVACDDRDADAHFALGRILYLRRDLDTSKRELEAAVSYNSNFAHAHLGLGTAFLWAGEWQRAIESFDRAMRLSPHDPLLWIVATARALAYLGARALPEAEKSAREGVRLPAATVTAYFTLASILGRLGKIDEAKEVMTEVYRLRPDINAEYVAQVIVFASPADNDYFMEGLHKAGLPR